jgi:hypothetical protein
MTPIALFVFNRPHLTAQVYERVRAARPSHLLVVADGPRPTRPEDIRLCAATRKIIKSPDWPCELLTNFAEENLGARRRISSGLDWVFDLCPEAIILEDDCVPCPSFFSFCSSMLSYYREDTRIMHITGNNFQGGRRRGNGSYFFSRYAHSWGWASWRRAWRYYDVSLRAWPIAKQQGWLASVLDDPLEIKYWTRIFDKTYHKLMEVWDYQWMFTCLTQSGLSVQPNENLVTNIGVGPDALHFKQSHSTIGIPTRELGECVHPTVMIRDKEADRWTFREHMLSKQSWLQKARNTVALRTRMKHLLRGAPRQRLSGCGTRPEHREDPHAGNVGDAGWGLEMPQNYERKLDHHAKAAD